MIPHTVIYSNTQAPYSEWVPTYVIVGVWDGPTFRAFWLTHEMWELVYPEAESLMDYYSRVYKTGEHKLRVCRWREDICEAIALCIRAAGRGFQVKVVYPSWEEDHCRHFILKR